MHEFSGFTVNAMRKAIEKLGFAGKTVGVSITWRSPS